ncbi:MAG: glycosyltransferase, partial [Ginsengibacter sp.]
MTGGMTNILMIIILALYTVSVLFLFFYSISQAYLVIKYISTRRKIYRDVPGLPDSNLPSITIQLPLYNEIFVAERIIDAAINLDYPAHKKQIQILDDSDDETTSITERKIAPYKKSGINIQHIRRRQRTGFKAGALRHALTLATGEYIAIFDADFIPPKDFLQKALPHFSDKNTGMVQTRWEHINRNQSLLTELQAFGLDAHFRVEQTGRNEANCFMNFNGTGGVWRKECIMDAGNWDADTLTEDLDLSYRAQLKGWKF